jgi:hypothetical protein
MPNGDPKDACVDGLEALKELVKDTLEKASSAKTELEKLEKQEPELKKARKNIDDVLASPDAFVERRQLPAFDRPARYDLKLTRDPLGDGDTKTAELGSVRIGKNRFSVSAGLGISFIEEETFGRQQAPGEDGDPVSTFAVTERSSEHLAGVFQLNARLVSWGKNNQAGFHWSLGAEISSDDGSTELSLYTGPTFGFLDDSLFFTLAFHQRSVEELSGFEVGDPIPMEVMDPLPTTKEDKGGLLFTVTYRFN